MVLSKKAPLPPWALDSDKEAAPSPRHGPPVTSSAAASSAKGVIFSDYASAAIDDGKTGKRMPNQHKEACPFAQDSEPTGAGTVPPSPGRKAKKAEPGHRFPLGSDKVGSAVLDASVYLSNRQETAARLVSARTANSVGAGVFKYDAAAPAAEEEEED